MNKEEIYDSQIHPLMKQILDICKAEGIAMQASFAIGHDGEGPEGEDCSQLICSSHLPDGEGVFNERFSKANGIINARSGRIGGGVLHMTTTNPDGSATLTAILP